MGGLCAAQVWKSKPPGQWSKKEAKKILSSSPWAQQAIMPYHPLTEYGGRPPKITDPQIRIGQIPVDTRDDPTSVNARPSWTVTILWSSSRTVRRAMAGWSASGAYKPDPQHSEPRQRIEITVLTQTTTWPLPDWRESELRESTYLRFGKDGQEVLPERVKINYFPGTHRVESYWFAFAREDRNGEPYFSKNVKEVQFYCQLGPVAMQAKFEPAKMVAHDGPDI
jgi:hypothetical protein